MMRDFKVLAMRACHATTHRISAFRNGSDGAVALMVALLMPGVVGGISLGAEVGYWYMLERKMQHVADAAAYSGAVRRKAGESSSDVDATVQQIRASSGLPSDSKAVVLDDPDGDAKKLRVEVTYDVPLYFLSLFRGNGARIRVVATAEIDSEPSHDFECIEVLSDGDGALTIKSGPKKDPKVTLQGCDVIAHSNSSKAVVLDRTLKIDDGCVRTNGDVSGLGNLDTNISQISCEPPDGKYIDSLADLEKPTLDDCWKDWKGFQVECYDDLTLDNSNTNDNTVYIVRRSLASHNGTIAAKNVSFILDGAESIRFNGNSDIQLSAPKSGPLKNILFTGGKYKGDTKINGTNGSKFDGAIHLPEADIKFNGNSSLNCTSLIAQTIEFTGSSQMTCNNDRADDDEESGGSVKLLPLLGIASHRSYFSVN